MAMKLKLNNLEATPAKTQADPVPTSSTVPVEDHPEWLASKAKPITREYHKWTDSIEVLQKTYLEELGVPTKSTDRKFLIWRIRQARRGHYQRAKQLTAPSPDSRYKSVLIKFSPLELEALDTQVRASGLSRLEYIRSKLFPA